MSYLKLLPDDLLPLIIVYLTPEEQIKMCEVLNLSTYNNDVIWKMRLQNKYGRMLTAREIYQLAETVIDNDKFLLKKSHIYDIYIKQYEWNDSLAKQMIKKDDFIRYYIDAQDIYGTTLLNYMSCEGFQYETDIEKLIKLGAKLNIQDAEGWTALILAARYSKESSTEKTVQMLIDAGADLNIQENDGWTSLMSAAAHSNKSSTENTVKILIDAGADLNIQENEGWTALMLTVDNSNNDSTENTLKMLVQAGTNLNIQDNEGWTALMLTVENSNKSSTENTIKILIDAGANLNIQNNTGQTALLVAASIIQDEEVYRRISSLLISKGADVSLTDTEGRNYQERRNSSIQNFIV